MRYHKRTNGNPLATCGVPIPKCYDQFLVTCSDDGSVNVYDVSSLYKHTYDEYYTKGSNDSSPIYQVHQRHVKLIKGKT